MTCFRLASGETVSSYCKKNNLCYKAIWNRIEEGMSVDEAIKDYLPRKGNMANHVKYFYKGQNLYAYFKQNLMKYNKVLYRMRKGMSIEQAVKAVELKYK